jgi:hypothetical protein
MMRDARISRVAALLTAAALVAVPAASAAQPEDPGKPEDPGSNGKGHAKKDLGQPDDPGSQGQGKAKGVTYVFKGTYEGDGAVTVDHGNAHVKKADLIGETVSFDLADAKIVVADNNADGKRDLSDVATGDRVVVKSRMPRTEPAEQPFPARQLVDQTHLAEADED